MKKNEYVDALVNAGVPRSKVPYLIRPAFPKDIGKGAARQYRDSDILLVTNANEFVEAGLPVPISLELARLMGRGRTCKRGRVTFTIETDA